MVSVTKKPVYPKVYAVLRAKHTKEKPLRSDECRRLIGWTDEPEDEDWGNEFTLKDLYGRKVRLQNNPTNRPFKQPLADRYTNEHLRGKWSLNLETIVISKEGNVLQGQHRLVGFILAEQMREINPKRWGKSPLEFEVLMGFGVSSLPENANTYDLGAKRSLGDVLYRQHEFGKKVSDKEQRRITTILSGAIRLVWLRSGGKQISFAPHFPHSEAIEFYEKHPHILQAVEKITSLENGEEGNEKRISPLISLSYAAALLYLMGKATDTKKASEFWEAFASGEGLTKGSAILSLRQSLIRMDASSGSKRDEIVGTVIKSWLLWSSDKAGASKDIRVARKKVGDRIVMAEFPRIGGIDSPVEVEVMLTLNQLVILNTLHESKEKELTYKHLQEELGLQVGTLATAITAETRQGKTNPHSLESRGLLTINEYEPQEGEKVSPLYFQLTAKGKKLLG